MLHRQPMKVPPALEQLFRGFRLQPSKHRQFDRDGKRIEGKVLLNSNSGLHKLVRAARRGKLSDARAVLIEQTQAIAARHPTLHMSPAAKERRLQAALAS